MPPGLDYECRICENAKGNRAFTAREMMFGLRDTFEYVECARCGCVQIANLPDDLSKYYPGDYYSFEEPQIPGALKGFLKRRRAAQALGRPNFLGRLLVSRYGTPLICQWATHARVGFDDAVLDVGCGRGARLMDMYASGFSNLTGIDPYIEQYVNIPGIRIMRCGIAECEGVYDLVMLHHTFEHLSDPFDTLRHVHRLLKPGGCALIRTPVTGTYAWRAYQADWVQLDAPRHFFVHSPTSMQICAGRTGFEITGADYDSTAFQFWASEQYKRDIPLRAEESYATSPEKSIFAPEEIVRFENIARALNEEHDGDQACFYLRRK